MATQAPYFVLLVSMLYKVQARHLISDGTDHNNNVLALDHDLQKICVHDYGFFPCADNIGGYIFQMVVYQYLLILGEKFLTMGTKKLFNILGTGIFGASLFRVLMVFPGLIMFIGT